MPPSSLIRAAILAGISITALACGSSSSVSPVASATPTSQITAPPSASAAASAAVPPARPQGPPPDPALIERLRADVLTVSGERPPGWSKWGAVQNNVADRLKATGFEVEEQVFDGLADTAGAVHKGVNVIGRKKGRSKSEEVVILSAHYDHIPGCDGADDNASGVAVVLEAAKVLGQRSFDRTLILAFWDWEEWGLLGSTAYAQRERAKRTDIKLAISLDGVGFADHRPGSQQVPSGLDIVAPEIVKELEESGSLGDFIAVIGDTDAEPFVSAYRKHGAARGLPVVGSGLSAMSRLVLLDTARSDHASFWLAGFPAMLVTDTANFRNPRYHCYDGADTPDTLDYTFLARVASTTIDVVAESL